MASVDVMQLEEKASMYAWDDMVLGKSSDYVLDDLRHMPSMHVAEHTAAQHSAPQHNASPPKISWQLVSKPFGN